jgi:hypothetical protein
MKCKDATAFDPLIIPYPKDPDDLIPDLDGEEDEEEEVGDEDE